MLVLQQALEDCYRYTHFAQDARDHDDAELAELFDELAEQDRELVARLKKVLASRIAG